MSDISEKTLTSSIPDDIHRKPTAHFKEYCGGEWLNKKGMITRAQAIDFLNYNMKKRGIEERNGIIFLNDWMKGLLQEYRTIINRDELPGMIEKFFAE